MVLSTLGSAAYGVGDQGISIDGAVPAALAGLLAGEPRWLSTSLIIFQNNTAGGLYTYHTGTLALTLVDPLGENRLGAGNGVYAAYLAGIATRTNISGLASLPAAAIGDVTETGQVIIVPDAANYAGVAVYDVTGTGLWSIATGLAGGTSPHGRVNYTTYADVTSSTWHVWQNTPPLSQSFTAPSGFPVVWTIPCVVNGAVYVLEQSDRLTFRQKDATQGYVITTGLSFNPDVRILSPGVVRIGWCLDAGESTGSLMLMDLVVTNGVNQVGVVSGGTMVFTAGATLPNTAIPGTPTDLGGTIGDVSGLYPPLRQPVQSPQNQLITKAWANWAIRIGTTVQTLTRSVAGTAGGATPPTSALPNTVVPSRASVILTDAQILTLPTAAVTVVAAPPAGSRIKVLASTMALHASDGFYTGVDATFAALVLCHDTAATGAWIAVGPVNDSSITTAPAELEVFLGTPNHDALIDLPAYLTPWTDAALPGYVLPGQGFPDFTNVSGKALVVSMDNNGAGDLGGGNILNSLRITVYYVIEPVS